MTLLYSVEVIRNRHFFIFCFINPTVNPCKHLKHSKELQELSNSFEQKAFYVLGATRSWIFQTYQSKMASSSECFSSITLKVESRGLLKTRQISEDGRISSKSPKNIYFILTFSTSILTVTSIPESINCKIG